MRIIGYVAAIYCTVVGLLTWFFPKTLIRINDWMTEKILLHEMLGTLYRLVIGFITLLIAGIFWWILLSP